MRALALLENRFDRRLRADRDLDRRGEQDAELVDHRQIARIRDDDLQEAAVRTLAPVRHEPVAQHQVGRNRSEQLLIDAERFHVDELEAVAVGQPARFLDFSRPLAGAELRLGVERRPRESCRVCVSHQDVVNTELNWKSGMYSASSSAAITMPMMTSSSGSTSVTNRSMLVEISSS